MSSLIFNYQAKNIIKLFMNSILRDYTLSLSIFSNSFLNRNIVISNKVPERTYKYESDKYYRY